MNIDVMKCQIVKEKELEYDVLSLNQCDNVFEIAKELGMSTASEEYVYLFCVDTKFRIVGIHEVSHGDICSSTVHPREIMKRALLNNACGIIMAHNHPSGDIEPSKADIDITKRIEDAGKIMGIRLYDHIIVGGENYTSMRMEDYIED